MTKLFIIGNGFDLAHNLKTSYIDLKNYVKKNDKHIYQQINKQIFIGETCLWNNFEENVGTDDSYFETEFKQVVNDAYQLGLDMESGGNPLLGDVLIQTENADYARENEISEYLYNSYSKFRVEELHSKFIDNLERMLSTEEQKDTVRNIFLEKYIQNKFNFITFNYTHTLESVYNIDHENILYIHGELGGTGQLIFGNINENMTHLSPEKYIEDDHEAEDYQQKVEEWNVLSEEERQFTMSPETHHDYSSHPNPNAVDYSEYVEQYNASKEDWIKEPEVDILSEYVSNLDIKEIIVIGHSFGKVDWEYMLALDKKFKNADWFVSVHEPKNEKGEKDEKDEKDKSDPARKNFE